MDVRRRIMVEEEVELQGEDVTIEDVIVDIEEGCETENVVTEEAPKEEQIELLDWADLYIRCSCGASTALQRNIQQGAVRFFLPTALGKTLDLQCPVCEHKLSLAFMEAFAPPAPAEEPELDTEEDEQVQEEDKTKE